MHSHIGWLWLAIAIVTTILHSARSASQCNCDPSGTSDASSKAVDGLFAVSNCQDYSCSLSVKEPLTIAITFNTIATRSGLEVVFPRIDERPASCPIHVNVTGNTFSSSTGFKVTGSLPPNSTLLFQNNTMTASTANKFGQAELHGRIAMIIITPSTLGFGGDKEFNVIIGEGSTLTISDNILNAELLDSLEFSAIAVSTVRLDRKALIQIRGNTLSVATEEQMSQVHFIYILGRFELGDSDASQLLFVGNDSGFLASENFFELNGDLGSSREVSFFRTTSNFTALAGVTGSHITFRNNVINVPQSNSPLLFVAGLLQVSKLIISGTEITTETASMYSPVNVSSVTIVEGGILHFQSNVIFVSNGQMLCTFMSVRTMSVVSDVDFRVIANKMKSPTVDALAPNTPKVLDVDSLIFAPNTTPSMKMFSIRNCGNTLPWAAKPEANQVLSTTLAKYAVEDGCTRTITSNISNTQSRAQSETHAALSTSRSKNSTLSLAYAASVATYSRSLSLSTSHSQNTPTASLSSLISDSISDITRKSSSLLETVSFTHSMQTKSKSSSQQVSVSASVTVSILTSASRSIVRSKSLSIPQTGSSSATLSRTRSRTSSWSVRSSSFTNSHLTTLTSSVSKSIALSFTTSVTDSQTVTRLTQGSTQSFTTSETGLKSFSWSGLWSATYSTPLSDTVQPSSTFTMAPTVSASVTDHRTSPTFTNVIKEPTSGRTTLDEAREWTVGVESVAVLGVVGAGSVTDLQSSSVFRISQCANPTPEAKEQLYQSLSPTAISPTCEGVIAGNFILVGAVALFSLLATAIVKRVSNFRCMPWTTSMATVQCPSLLIVAVSFTQSSVAVCAATYMHESSFGVGLTLASCIVAVVAVLPLVAYVFGTRRLSKVVLDRRVVTPMKHFLIRVLLPSGSFDWNASGHYKFMPLMFSTVVASYRYSWPWLALVNSMTTVATWPCLIPSTGSSLCPTLYWLSATLHFAFAVFIIGIRPRRLVLTDIFHALSLALNGTLAALTTADVTGASASAAVYICNTLTAISVLRVTHQGLLLAYQLFHLHPKLLEEYQGDYISYKFEWEYVGLWHRRTLYTPNTQTFRDMAALLDGCGEYADEEYQLSLISPTDSMLFEPKDELVSADSSPSYVSQSLVEGLSAANEAVQAIDVDELDEFIGQLHIDEGTVEEQFSEQDESAFA